MVAGGMDKEDCVSIESLGIFFGSSGAISTDKTLLVDRFCLALVRVEQQVIESASMCVLEGLSVVTQIGPPQPDFTFFRPPQIVPLFNLSVAVQV